MWSNDARLSGVRLIIGIVVMGVVVPVTLFLLLNLQTPAQLFTLAATSFLAWGVCDLFSTILEKPRLKGRSPGHALRTTAVDPTGHPERSEGSPETRVKSGTTS
jgi:hypothetical protein